VELEVPNQLAVMVRDVQFVFWAVEQSGEGRFVEQTPFIPKPRAADTIVEIEIDRGGRPEDAFDGDYQIGRLVASRPFGRRQFEIRDGDRQPTVGARRRLMRKGPAHCEWGVSPSRRAMNLSMARLGSTAVISCC